LRHETHVGHAVSQDGVAAPLMKVAVAIAARAAACDQDGVYPVEDIDDLRREGLMRMFARPAEPDATELMNVLRVIGRANLSVGRIYEGHVNGAKLVSWYGSQAQRARLAANIDAGHSLAVWATEAPPGVTLLREGAGWRLDGAKIFATGAGHVDSALITARLSDERKQLVWVNLRGHTDRSDPFRWQVRGMRATVSGSFDFTGMEVETDDLVGEPGDYEAEPRFTAGAWRFAAVQLGGVEALVVLLRERLQTSGGEGDAIHRARFAAAVSAARTAALWVEKAALMAEALDADSVPLTLMTRGVVEEAGLLVMDIVARTLGTRAFFNSHPADRIARDLGLYLRQAKPDQARDRAATAWLEADRWRGDPLW
jgi:alkylation response protein AidB-like acyl-CoA dehydrogenase